MAESAQTPDTRDLMARLQRLERDMRDLQAVTFRRGAGAAVQASAPESSGGSAPPAESQQTTMPDLNPVLRRIDEIEEGLGHLTGQVEELGHQVDQLSQKADRLQKEFDFQAAAQPKAANEMPPASSQSGSEIASVDSDRNSPGPLEAGTPPATLGRLPADAPLPVPAGKASDPKRQFDDAMNLLSRAQYDKASETFRSFADSHPDEARAPDALYWTGDIAYSTKKDYAEAARDFAELLKKYPKAQRAPEGMLKLGLALFELGQTKEGCAALAALPAKYPAAAPAIAMGAKSAREEKKCR